ncbi:MAG: hypothetical protein ACRDKK_01395 [Gaiellaceae bacterium]
MHARRLDEASEQLRELRHEVWEGLGLGALALGLAVAAAEFRPALAVPLFFGGLVVGGLGMRALLRRSELVERLAGERDAYAIPEVLAWASREATMERRQTYAALLRNTLKRPGLLYEARVLAAAEELEALASELDDEELELDPARAVACMRLLSDVFGSPLLNSALPPEDLRSRIVQIRSGFKARRLAA